MNAESPGLWKVDLVWERDWNLGLVGRTLLELNYFGILFGGFPKYRYLKLGIPPQKIRTRPAAAIWNYGIHRLRLPPGLRMDEPGRIGSWVARQKRLSPAILVNGTAYRFLFPKLLNRSTFRLVERGSMYPEDFFRFPQKARREAGYPFQEQLPPEILDEMQKAPLAETTICGSEMVRKSYLKRGFPEASLYTAHYGVNPAALAPATHKDPQGRSLQIGWLGVIGFRKGIDRARRISEWAAQKKIPLEFHFVGPIQDPESREILRGFRCPYILHGVKKGAALQEVLSRWDLYLLPSYEEGLAISLLLAMSAKIPAFVDQDTGCREPVRAGVNGEVFEGYSREELDQKLLPWLVDQTKRRVGGEQARETILQKFTTGHYRARIAKIHERLQEQARPKYC
jgi:glycosyltransferase involved in cell wall biosynthesis